MSTTSQHANTYTGSGVVFARYAKALAIARGDALSAEAYAQGQSWHSTPAVLGAIKALIDPVTAETLAGTRAVAQDFAVYARARSVLGRLEGLRRVPFRTRMLNASAGTSAGWIGEGNRPIPVSSMAISDGGIQLQPLRVGGISIVTQELVRQSNPVAEGLIARDVAAGVIAAMDAGFLDPDFAGVADVSPASISYGADALESSGSDVGAIDSDLKQMLGVLTAAEMSLASAAWIMTPATATALSLLRGTGGAPAFPGISPRGGRLLDLPVLTTTQSKASGSPAESVIALVEAQEVLVADDDQAEISISGDASVQLDDAPSDGAQQLVSLWQSGLVGIRGIRTINWQRRRSGCVAVLRGVQL